MKKLLISFLASLIILLSFAPYFPARAQSTWYNQNPFEWYIKVYDKDASPPNEIFGERYTASQVQWVIYSILFTPVNMFYAWLEMDPSPSVCAAKLMVGTIDVTTCMKSIPDFLNAIANKLKLPTITSNTNSSNLAYQKNKSSVWKSIFLEDRPLSGISYIRDIGRKFTLVPEAKAQETYGFSRLAPIQPLWKITRNIAYFFFVLIIIIMAFMIMFKIKISPQVVITIQSALPKIILTVLLVTFSYAIAGFAIDLIYVVMGLFSQFFTAIVGGSASPMDTYNFLNGGEGFFIILFYSIGYIILYIVFTVVIILMIFVGSGFTNWAATVMGLMLLVFSIGILIVLVYNIFAGLFYLFKALAGFYVAVIFGPISLALGAIPGSGSSFGKWFKSIIGKLAVFPATGIIWYFAYLFLFGALAASAKCGLANFGGGITQGAFDNIVTAARSVLEGWGLSAAFTSQFTDLIPLGHCWNPPLLGNAGGATAIAFLMISAGCILMLTKVQKTIESALAGKEFAGGSALSEAIGVAGGVGGVAASLSGTRLMNNWAMRPTGTLRRTVSDAVYGAANLKALHDVRIP